MPQKPRHLTPLAGPWHFFGAEIRRMRTGQGLSQNRLGGLLHVSGDLISKIEKGERRPRPDVVADLDRLFAAGGLLVRLAALARVVERWEPPAGPGCSQRSSPR